MGAELALTIARRKLRPGDPARWAHELRGAALALEEGRWPEVQLGLGIDAGPEQPGGEDEV